jgi:hypothetical protein
MAWDSKTDWSSKDELINVKKDTDNSGLEELEDSKYKKFIKKTYQVIQNIEELGLPNINEQIKIITFRSFNAAIFLKYIAEKEGIENMQLVVYSINGEAALMIDDLFKKGLIDKGQILMSNLRNKAHRQKEQITRDLFVENPKIDLFFASSHAKILSLKTKKGNYYSLEGSGNLSYNSRVENYCIDNDEKLYNFHCNWMEDIKSFLKGKKELVLT